MGNKFYEIFGLKSLEFGLNNHSLSIYVRYIVFFISLGNLKVVLVHRACPVIQFFLILLRRVVLNLPFLCFMST